MILQHWIDLDIAEALYCFDGLFKCPQYSGWHIGFDCVGGMNYDPTVFMVLILNPEKTKALVLHSCADYFGQGFVLPDGISLTDAQLEKFIKSTIDQLDQLTGAINVKH